VADLLVRLTCPKCGHVSDSAMPTDQCVFFYECPNCKAVLKPKPGDCCVFCSYGDKRCPFVQDHVPCPDQLPG
jgi:hypothetical protein